MVSAGQYHPTGFALWSRPEIVVVSGGYDGVDRRSLEAVKESYRARGAKVLHTAEAGAVRLELSAAGVSASTFRAAAAD